MLKERGVTQGRSRPGFLLLAPDLRHVTILNGCQNAFDRDPVNIGSRGWLKDWSRDLYPKAKQKECTVASLHTCFGVLYVMDAGRWKIIIFPADSRVYPLGQVILYHPVTAFFWGWRSCSMHSPLRYWRWLIAANQRKSRKKRFSYK